MIYFAFFNIGRLQDVTEEVRFVHGKEQVCLVIPTDTNQMYKGRNGEWNMQLCLYDKYANDKGRSHIIQLQFRNMEDMRKAQAEGWWKRLNHLGNVYPEIKAPKVDRENRAKKIEFHGYLSLSDIPQHLITTHSISKKKYLTNVTITDPTDPNTIYSGSICLSEILVQFRYRSSETGKYYAKIVFKTSDKLDYSMNTHVIYATDKNGTMIEIGRLKEWRKDIPVPVDNKESPQPSPPNSAENTPRTPKSIDGMKF